jgi:hypothetical protein
VDTLPAVQQWREALTFEQRDMWNHPTTIKRNYERMTAVRKQREQQEAQHRKDSLADRHIALQEQHTALLALRGGAFPNDLTPEALADLCANHRNTDWLRRASAAFAKAAEREGRQDATMRAPRSTPLS